jgi:hypothetical protein
VNSLSLMDHNLLELGDHSVIGSDVHMSGHLVEHGRLVTASVRVGALSVVPKFQRLEAGGVYAGAPVRRIG